MQWLPLTRMDGSEVWVNMARVLWLSQPLNPKRYEPATRLDYGDDLYLIVRQSPETIYDALREREG